MNADSLIRNVETQGPSPNEQYVDGPKLLEILFPEDCRPTMRWLHDQHKARRIPSIKIGRLVFYSPAQVRQALEKK
jgi:hypothetical protein